MAKKLGVGIVGPGWVSEEHVKAYLNNPHTQIRGICGRNKERAEGLAAASGISCPTYTDYAKMLKRDDITIISICTPNHLHARESIQAAEAGKHILIEKPVALNPKDLVAMSKAVKKAKVKTVVSFVLRWNPLFETIKSLLGDDAIGKIFYAEVDYFHGIGPWYKQYDWNVKKKMGGSSMLSAGCHALDGLRWFMMDEVVEVSSYSTRGNGKDFKKFEYDPTSVVILKFKKGGVGKVVSCIESKMPYVFNIGLYGDKGSIRNNQLFSHKLPGQTGFASIPTILPDSGDVTHHPFQGEMDHLVDCILKNKESHVNLEDAFKTHEIAFAADHSAKIGRPVKLPFIK